MADTAALSAALTAAAAASADAVTAVDAKLDALAAQIATLESGQVPQATVDAMTTQVNGIAADIASIAALVA